MRALDALPRIAELSLDAVRQTRSIAVSLARTIAAPVLGERSEEDSGGLTRNWDPPPPRPLGDPPAAPGVPPRRAAAPPAPTAPPSRPETEPEPAPSPPEGAHVDRDAVVVAQSADAAAAEGAGAQIRIDEPWDGYGQLRARDVIAQLATADPAMLALVRLYESAHRKRRTVLAEVDRRLAASNG